VSDLHSFLSTTPLKVLDMLAEAEGGLLAQAVFTAGTMVKIRSVSRVLFRVQNSGADPSQQ
jgi:hypothetical protein